MIKKGIILSGGLGTRMSPITKSVNKQLLPIYDKPLIYYPLSILMLAGIKEILIIVNKGSINQFKKILLNGENLGIKIKYAEQNSPRGLPDAFKIGKNFIGNDNVALILGDNFFYGQSLTDKLKKIVNLKKGATILVHPVKNPNRFGVVTLKKNKIINLVEKPKNTNSNLIVSGLYFYTNDVIEYAKKLTPSKRGEKEITDINNIYISTRKLMLNILSKEISWIDTGTYSSLIKASKFFESLEQKTDKKFACIEEIAYNKGYINSDKLLQIADSMRFSDYGKYLIKVVNK